MLTQKLSRIVVPALAAVALLLAAPAAFAGEPGFRHTYLMKGNVIESSPETGIYLCIGTADGAEVGQVLHVVRISRNMRTNPKQGVRYRRDDVGQIRIERIVDEHFAVAAMVRGEAKEGDRVNLEEPGMNH